MSDRGFEWNWSIAMRTGVLKDAINAYKFRDHRWWAWIFGRIVVGFLDAHHDPFDRMDLIIPSPAYVGPGGRRSWNFIREVLATAQREQDPPGWPFHLDDPPAIIKTVETERLSGLGSYQDQRRYAEGPLYDALQVPDPALVEGRQIVVFDDIFTNGLTQRAVAQRLREAGASRVYGLTLARQPWGATRATD
jgi:predicted amidophosphoribosyltransferase